MCLFEVDAGQTYSQAGGALSAGVGVLQIADAVWMSMLLSAFAGILAVTVVVATFYFIRSAYCSPLSLASTHRAGLTCSNLSQPDLLTIARTQMLHMGLSVLSPPRLPLWSQGSLLHQTELAGGSTALPLHGKLGYGLLRGGWSDTGYLHVPNNVADTPPSEFLSPVLRLAAAGGTGCGRCRAGWATGCCGAGRRA